MAKDQPEAFLTDAEVLQEMLHRYLALRIWPEGGEQIQDFAELMRGRVHPLVSEDVELAVELATEHRGLEARDVVHLAVMRRLSVKRIVSADRGFDRVPDIERLDPAQLDDWRETVGQ